MPAGRMGSGSELKIAREGEQREEGGGGGEGVPIVVKFFLCEIIRRRENLMALVEGFFFSLSLKENVFLRF